MDSSESSSATASCPPPRRHWRRWLLLTAAAVVLVPAIGLGIWSVVALAFSYSHGERAGYVQKFSRRGWICPSWEGELAMVNVPGAMQEKWEFTVRSDSIAKLIQGSMGTRVTLSYDQHKGVPTSCFGDTEYFVTGVRSLGP